MVLIDDILDTGATLSAACQRLLCAGVEDIQIMVTHGLFTGDAWQALWALGVSSRILHGHGSAPGRSRQEPNCHSFADSTAGRSDCRGRRGGWRIDPVFGPPVKWSQES